MKKKISIGLIALSLSGISASSYSMPERPIPQMRWTEVSKLNDPRWLRSDEAKRVAENVLWYQRDCGAWPKNTEMHLPIEQEWPKTEGTNHALPNIDNDATTMEMRFLGQMYSVNRDKRYRAAFNKGADYLLKAQYANGGWPQFYPLIGRYFDYITFNDNAIINVMELFDDIIQKRNGLDFIDAARVERCRKANEKGLECILKTQIEKNGQLGVWCAQYDPQTLKPMNARSFELASYSGLESVDIVNYLMNIEKPSPQIVRAVKGAIKWFEEHRIEGLSKRNIVNSEGVKDIVMVEDPKAQTLWGRFVDLDTEKPFFCDRDGVKREKLSDIGHERRNGYGWYTDHPNSVLKRYPEWKKRLNIQ